jgi:hypothetical protein
MHYCSVLFCTHHESGEQEYHQLHNHFFKSAGTNSANSANSRTNSANSRDGPSGWLELAHSITHGGWHCLTRRMPAAAQGALEGSLEVLHGISGAPNPSMPRSDLREPINGPVTEKWCVHPASSSTGRASPAERTVFDICRWYEEDPDQGLRRMGCCGKKLEGEEGCLKGGLFGGVIDDYRRRLPNYGKDITQGITPKTLSSALFMFFATFFSTASLGALIQKATNKRIGLEEYLLMNAIAGMTHALFGCQVRTA